jgi:hypothetical protein
VLPPEFTPWNLVSARFLARCPAPRNRKRDPPVQGPSPMFLAAFRRKIVMLRA